MSASAAAPSAAAAKAADASRLPQTAPLSKYKVVFLGDQGTGKTSIIKAFMYGSFDHNYQVSQRRCGGAALPLRRVQQCDELCCAAWRGAVALLRFRPLRVCPCPAVPCCPLRSCASLTARRRQAV